MKGLRTRFFRWLVRGRRGSFALALAAMATLSLGGVSCSKAPEPERKVKMYQSPMHPWITSEKPGNCTICGMALVPVYEGESGIEVDPGIVALNPRSVDVLAVTAVPVRRLDLFEVTAV
jgi:Heavy metal binding domain